MPRRGNVPKREVLPDPQYNSVLVTKLVNSIMLDGKKGVAQKVVYGAFEIVENKTGKNGLEVFQQAMENIMPAVELKARRVGITFSKACWNTSRPFLPVLFSTISNAPYTTFWATPFVPSSMMLFTSLVTRTELY